MNNKDGALPSGRAFAASPSIPDVVWVIVRSTGEYSDRVETPIRFCLSEEEAREAINLIGVEKQRDTPPPWPEQESPYAWFKADGTMTENFYEAAGVFRKKPDGDEIEARNEAARALYYEAISKLCHVDPEGSWCGDNYYYSEVTLWAARATGTGSIRQDESAVRQDAPNTDAKQPGGEK